MARPRVKVPKTASAGEVITIKTLMSHKMESGQRKDRKTGEIIPRMIINKFNATFNGTEVFSVDIEPAVSANPFLQFSVKVPESGEFHFKWVDDSGKVFETK
ncbi:MAG: thiosulfate oxidation carrier complex protein SoxZ, partial [Pseudomonadota bacterium]